MNYTNSVRNRSTKHFKIKIRYDLVENIYKRMNQGRILIFQNIVIQFQQVFFEYEVIAWLKHI